MKRTRVVIMGAAGRDFHNFNVYFRNNTSYEVVAFTATQIPDIEGRVYPRELAGPFYPNGIPIYAEEDLATIIKTQNIDEVFFAYSDVMHTYVMHKASLVMACGANFSMLGANATMVKSTKPVVSICAVRTGCGKSQTTRKVVEVLKAMGKKVVSIRHPMPYGDLAAQKCQRFATLEDLKKHKCTIEEMEEYEPHIVAGNVIYAGVDYEAIVREAEKEADVILWDGGNNDLPFYKSDCEIVVVDPHRPGHETTYHPGETNLNRAEVIVINKVDSAEAKNIAAVREACKKANPNALIIEADSPVSIEKPEMIKGKRVLVVEDGPTLTHGEMKYGAGIIAAQKFGAKEIIDPRPWVKKSIAYTFEKYPYIGTLMPAMGYGEQQMKDLEESINAVDCDVVLIATPIDLGRLLKINKPSVRVSYELAERGNHTLKDVLKKFK